MTVTITLLVLISAALHPLWNLLIKKDNEPEVMFVSMAFGVSMVSLIHGLLIGARFWLTPAEWLLIAGTVSGQILYSTALAATLRRGDLSAYYPVIRASPVFIVGFSFLFLGTTYDWVVLLGIALVLVGAFFLLYRRGTNLLHDWQTLALAVLAMCGTGIYSITDSRLMTTLETPVLFFWVELLCWPLLAFIHSKTGKQIPGFLGIANIFAKPFLHLKLIACLYGSYTLILTAYNLGGDVASVTTVRQASIPLSVILGGYFLNEGAIARRLVASAILSAGIVVVILYG